MPATITINEFWSRASLDDNGCLVWRMARNACGYGTLTYRGKAWLAHRLAYKFTHGEITNHILHSCDNPACINPAHLRDGTHQDNMTDISLRKRQSAHTKTHCKSGHLLSGKNLYMVKSRGVHGQRMCRTCVKIRQVEKYWRNRLFTASLALFDQPQHPNNP